MRYTETKLEKIIRVGFARIDQITEKVCDDLEAIKPKKDPSNYLDHFGISREAIRQANLEAICAAQAAQNDIARWVYSEIGFR